MAMTRYLTLRIGDHYESCELSHKPMQQQKGFYRVQVKSVPCCSAIPHQSVIDELVKQIGEEHKPGWWMFANPGPEREDWGSSENSCVENSNSNMAKLMPQSSKLRQRLTAALAEKPPQKKEFAEILRRIDALPDKNADSNLKKNTLFALHSEKFAQAICKGIPWLEKAEPKLQKQMLSEMVKFRSSGSDNLHKILSKYTENTPHSEKKIWKMLRWAWQTTIFTASCVARTANCRYRKTGDKDKERDIRQKEKLPRILYNVIDELLPVHGVRAIAIFAAMKQQGYLFKDDLRDIPTCSISAFAKSVAKQLKDVDLSRIPTNILVLFPLPVVLWAHGLIFRDICLRLGLKNLAGLGLDPTAKFDPVAADWCATDWGQLSETETIQTVDDFERRMHYSLQDLIDQANANPICEIEIDVATNGIVADVNEFDDTSASESEMELTTGRTNRVEACPSNADAAVVNDQSLSMPTQQTTTTDSGYASIAGSQYVTRASPVDSPSVAFMPNQPPSHRNAEQDSPPAACEIRGVEEMTHAAAGQKRPYVADNNSSKRVKPSAESASETSSTAEAGPMPADLTSTIGITLQDEHAPSFGVDPLFGATSRMPPIELNLLAGFGDLQDFSVPGFNFDELDFGDFSSDNLQTPPFLLGQQRDGTLPGPEPEIEHPAAQEKN